MPEKWVIVALELCSGNQYTVETTLAAGHARPQLPSTDQKALNLED
jgi:hypothetical protein